MISPSGRRPGRTRVVTFGHTFREHGENWTAMPEFFKNHGYFTSSAGKIYHDGQDDKASWPYPSNQTKWIHCVHGDLGEQQARVRGRRRKRLRRRKLVRTARGRPRGLFHWRLVVLASSHGRGRRTMAVCPFEWFRRQNVTAVPGGYSVALRVCTAGCQC